MAPLGPAHGLLVPLVTFRTPVVVRAHLASLVQIVLLVLSSRHGAFSQAITCCSCCLLLRVGAALLYIALQKIVVVLFRALQNIEVVTIVIVEVLHGCWSSEA